MLSINNKFEIGEECYTVYREPISYKCPICEGNGKFKHNGYDIWCKNCNGSGKTHNPKQTVLAVCKIRIERIVVSIWNNQIEIRYCVAPIDNALANINKRIENTIFKTEEEAEKYCVAVNTKEITPEF